MPAPRWINPQLSKLATKAPSGSQWVHEIKFDGYRMAARIDQGKVTLLTRTGLDWTKKYQAQQPRSPSSKSNPPISTANSAASGLMA